MRSTESLIPYITFQAVNRNVSNMTFEDRVARKFLHMEKQEIDLYEPSNFKNLSIDGKSISFELYLKILKNIDWHRENRKSKIRRFRNRHGKYGFRDLAMSLRRVKNSSNKPQEFWNQLFHVEFRLYVQLLLSDWDPGFTSDDLFETASKCETLPFTRISQLYSLINNEQLLRSEKIFLISTSLSTYRRCQNYVKACIDKKNLLPFSIEQIREVYNIWDRDFKSSRATTLESIEQNNLVLEELWKKITVNKH